MNCKRFREAITRALAAGDAELSTNLAAHLETCGTCHSFYQAQSSLLRTIDAGLRATMSQELTDSLLPGLQTRMESQAGLGRLGLPAWNLAVVVALGAVLALSFVRTPPQPVTRPSPLASASIGPPVAPTPSPIVEIHRSSITPLPRRIEKHLGSQVETTETPQITIEVIVLAEEREAFAKFVAVLPMQTEVAVALTHPAPSKPDPPVEIALLQIRSVEVTPLEGMPGK